MGRYERDLLSAYRTTCMLGCSCADRSKTIYDMYSPQTKRKKTDGKLERKNTTCGGFKCDLGFGPHNHSFFHRYVHSITHRAAVESNPIPTGTLAAITHLVTRLGSNTTGADCRVLVPDRTTTAPYVLNIYDLVIPQTRPGIRT